MFSELKLDVPWSHGLLARSPDACDVDDLATNDEEGSVFALRVDPEKAVPKILGEIWRLLCETTCKRVAVKGCQGLPKAASKPLGRPW